MKTLVPQIVSKFLRIQKLYKKRNRRTLFVLLLSLIFFWLFYQIYRMTSPSVKTEMAILTTVEDVMHVKGHIVRKETLIKTDYQDDGVVVLGLKNGQRVSRGGVVASVFNDTDDTVAKEKIKIVESEIQRLKSLNRSRLSFTSSPNEISKQICNKIRSILLSTNNFLYQEALSEKEKLLELLNERQILTGKIENFDNRISILKKEQEELLTSCKSSTQIDIKSLETGNFVDHLDGFENKLSFESVLSLKPEDINSLGPPEDTSDKKNIIGKVINDLFWYICFVVDPQNITKFKEEMEIIISIPVASSQKIPAKIVAINQKDKNSEAVVVCCCDYMNSELINIREEEVLINIKSYCGIKIPKVALHEETIEGRRVTGVFVLWGNEITFKEIVPTYVMSDYVICQQNPEPEKLISENPLKIYDQIVIEGSGLFVGKIVK